MQITRSKEGRRVADCLKVRILAKLDMVKLISKEGQALECPTDVARESALLKTALDETDASEFLPVPNVESSVLSKVIDFCKYKVDTRGEKGEQVTPDEERAWEAEFVRVDQCTLMKLILAANYLEIASLLDLTCKTVANMIQGKTVEEIRAGFNVKNDFTPEEEEEIRQENQWMLSRY